LKFNQPSTDLLAPEDISELVEKYSDYLKGTNRQVELLKSVIEFSSVEDIGFLEFFCTKHSNDCSDKTNDTIHKTLNVRRSRLNKELQVLNLYVDKDYRLNKINTTSFEYMQKQLISLINNKYIKHVRIFDSLIDTQNGSIKEQLFGKELENFLKRFLNFDDNKLEVVSIFDNEYTRDYYKRILRYHYRKNLQSILSINCKYKPFPSILYALITDENNNKYIFYYEKLTSWSVVEKVETSLDFSEKFWELLERRFEYYSNDSSLKKYNEIIPVELDLFELDFFESTEDLIEDINELLKNNRLNSLLNEEDIKLEISKLIKKLINIKIAFPKTRQGHNILYYHIQIVETLLLLKINPNKYKNTREVLTLIDELELTNNICENLSEEVKKDKYILNAKSFENINLKELQGKFILEGYFDGKSFSDIFIEYNWNTEKQIIKSLNDILLNKDSALQIISRCVNNFDEDGYSNIFKRLDEKYSKIIFRAILDAFYKIPFDSKILLTQSEIDYLKELDYKYENLTNSINRILMP